MKARSSRARPSAFSAAASSAACSLSPPGAWAIASTPSRPETDTPTGQVADLESRRPTTILTAFASSRATSTLSRSSSRTCPRKLPPPRPSIAPVRPAGSVLHITQNRLREKIFLAKAGIPVTPFTPVDSPMTR